MCGPHGIICYPLEAGTRDLKSIANISHVKWNVIFYVFYSIYEAISIKSPYTVRCRRKDGVYMQNVDKSIHLYTYLHAGCWTGDTISISRRKKVFIYSLPNSFLHQQRRRNKVFLSALLNSFLHQQCRRNKVFIYSLLYSFLHQQCRRNKVFIYSLLNSFLHQQGRRNNVFIYSPC